MVAVGEPVAPAIIAFWVPVYIATIVCYLVLGFCLLSARIVAWSVRACSMSSNAFRKRSRRSRWSGSVRNLYQWGFSIRQVRRDRILAAPRRGQASTLADAWCFELSWVLRQRPNRDADFSEASNVRRAVYFLVHLHQQPSRARVCSCAVLEVPVSRDQLLFEREVRSTIHGVPTPEQPARDTGVTLCEHCKCLALLPVGREKSEHGEPVRYRFVV